MKNLLGFISKKYKYLLSFILGGIVFGSSVYAVTIASSTITYDNTNSNLSATNVQGAIDELYTKANSCNVSLKELGNSNIVSVKNYDDTSNSSTYCVTGNEATCQSLTPAKTGTYKKGTIIDYKVNSSTTRRFHVLHDDGDKLTLQEQKNIVDNVAYVTKSDFIAAGGTESEWNSCVWDDGRIGCNTRGPVTILSALESATNSWTNVNLMTYTPGTTSFLGNSNTGCTQDACSSNKFTMGEHTARARLITIPEAWRTGCEIWSNGTCPKYMSNYLKLSNENDGIIDGEEKTYGYWTMNTSSYVSTLSWQIIYERYISGDLVDVGSYGARAVIEINK